MNNNAHKITEDFLQDLYSNKGEINKSEYSAFLDDLVIAKKVILMKKIIKIILYLMLFKLFYGLLIANYYLLFYDLGMFIVGGFIFYYLSEKSLNPLLYFLSAFLFPLLILGVFINGIHYSLIPCMISIYGILNYLAKTFNFQLFNAFMAFTSTIVVLLLSHFYTYELAYWAFDLLILVSSFGSFIYVLYFYQKEITERKEVIIRNNLFLREITDMNPDSIFVKDTNYKYVFVNQEMSDNYGKSKEGMLGKSRGEILVNSPRNKEISKQDDLVLKNEEIYSEIEEYIDKDESKKYLKVNKTPIRSFNGEVKGILGVVTDISDRVKSDKALFERELIFKALLDNVYDGIEIYERLEGNGSELIERNQKMRDFVGRTDEEISADGALINHSPTYQANGKKSEEYFPELFETYERIGRIHFEWDIYHANGNLLNLEISFFKMKVGERVFSIGIYKNITEKKKNDLALRESEMKYRSIFEHNSFGVVVARKGKFYDFNQAFCTMTGYSREEIKGNKIHQIMHPSDYQSTMPLVEDIINKKIPNIGIEHRFIRKDGSIGYAFIHFMQLYEINSESELVATLADISSLKEADLQLKEKNEELKKYIKSNSALESFAYVASHDLKEPIRSIVSFSQILQMNADDRLLDEEKEYLDFIINSSMNMQRLIEDLLAYSRVNAYNLKFEVIHLNDLIFSIERDLILVIKEKEAIINYPKLPQQLIADQTQMRQLFQNLITNALKFNAPNIAPEVIVSTEEKSDHYLFSISDNGIGIDPKHFDRIFLLFRRLHTKTEYDGTGIGLAMCKKIVENHQGEIWIESEKGKGATFYFTLSKSLVSDEEKSPQSSSI